MPEKLHCVIMRGGTSKGVFLRESELPSDPEIRDQVIRSVFGSPDVRQIDGLGGADALTSKLAIIGPPSVENADIDYTFAQVSITTTKVDYLGNCGNISSAVGPYAIDENIVRKTEPITKVRIYQTNTKKIIVAEVPVEKGKAVTSGDYAIAGVPGTGAEIKLDFADSAGSVTGKFLPTGNVVDTLQVPGHGRFEVTIVDAANPVVFIEAGALGLKGTETPQAIDSDPLLLEKIEAIRGVAAQAIGLTDSWDRAAMDTPYIPFFAIVSGPAEYQDYTTGEQVREEEADLVSRLFFMQKMHKAYPVTGTVCTGAAARIPGSIVNRIMRPVPAGRKIRIGHPAGVITVEAEAAIKENRTELVRAAISRTARRIMDGFVYVREEAFKKEKD
ncbi:MAG: 2-methylaconitate cis-trans isomerase PrpF family protein [Bacillota bacterium]